MRTGQGLGLGAWLLVIAWLVLYLLDRETAAGWCLVGAGLLLCIAGPIFRRVVDAQVRITGTIMLGAAVFFVVFGLFLVL